MGDLSKNFSRSEFACKCGCGYGLGDGDVSPLLVDQLQRLRDAIGKSIRIISGCRCRKHNAACGRAQSSQHVNGTAADFAVDGMTPAEVRVAVLLHCPAFVSGGIGIYDKWVHADVRRNTARWDERKKVA
jgi:uncharacterized protein YcbK (DUF882 family)